MVKRHKRSDKYVKRILEALQSEYGAKHPKARIDTYRYNPASVRIRIIDPDFKGLNLVEREEIVDPILDTLPDDIQAEITLLLLLTPSECKTSLGNLEFDDPTPSRL